MTSPPGIARTTSTTPSIDFSDIEALKTTAFTITRNCGLAWGPNKVNKLCVRFVDRIKGNGFDFFEFIANQVELTSEQRRRALSDPDIQRVIAYADPTGETAVNNITRGDRR